MATQIGEIIRDHNANVQYSGVGASVGTKAKISATQKKGGLGGRRKALNDLTNSAKHPSHQALNKPKKSVSIFGEGFGTLQSAGGKTSSIKTKTQGEAPNGGRKALGDLTNSSKPCLTEAPKKNLSKKLNAVAEDCTIPESIEEEGFLHNHKECIKGNRKGLNLKSFLEIVGVDDGIFKKDLASSEAIPRAMNPEPEGSASFLEWEEISDPEYAYPYPESKLKSPSPWSSPPESPNRWKLMDYEPDFTLMESAIKLKL